VLDTRPALIYAIGFSWRKRSLVRQFLSPSQIKFVRQPAQVPEGATAAVWASGPFGQQAQHHDLGDRLKRLFLEDGFLRSVGLGADLVRPLSWVIDSRGIYYDASRPSDLEHLLQTAAFDAPTLQRAATLRAQLVSTGLTKYNVGAAPWCRPAAAAGKKVVLVPGQFETDAAIRLGATGVSTNLALLQAARQAEPDAWLVYKPHPDVVAGLRNAGAHENLAAQSCDEIVTGVPMGTLLESVDAVHVLTSLTGFEALLRGKEVVCHGLPFYAGWGLTRDRLPLPRRSRLLSLDELVAGVLLLYPTYVSRVSRQVCTAEQALAELLSWRASSGAALPFWRMLLRPLLKRD
jgi:capsular polysaccharide export protein